MSEERDTSSLLRKRVSQVPRVATPCTPIVAKPSTLSRRARRKMSELEVEDLGALADALVRGLVAKPGIIGAFVVIIREGTSPDGEEIVSSIDFSSSLTFDNIAGCVVETLGLLRSQNK
jgi:hypothetical protein